MSSTGTQPVNPFAVREPSPKLSKTAVFAITAMIVSAVIVLSAAAWTVLLRPLPMSYEQPAQYNTTDPAPEKILTPEDEAEWKKLSIAPTPLTSTHG